MKLNPLFKIAPAGRVALAAAAAFLIANVAFAAEFFDDSVLKGTQVVHLDDAGPANINLTPVSINAPGLITPEMLHGKFPAAMRSPIGNGAGNPTTGEGTIAMVSMPVLAAILGVAGLLTFVAYWQRRSVTGGVEQAHDAGIQTGGLSSSRGADRIPQEVAS